MVKIVGLYLLAGVVLAASHGVIHWVDGMNTWLELAIKVGGALAAIGGGFKWCIGPGYRFVKRWALWVREHLELVARMDERLDRIEDRLAWGEDRFKRLDESLGVMASDEARAVRKSMRTGEPIRMTDAGNVDRRDLA